MNKHVLFAMQAAGRQGLYMGWTLKGMQPPQHLPTIHRPQQSILGKQCRGPLALK